MQKLRDSNQGTVAALAIALSLKLLALLPSEGEGACTQGEGSPQPSACLALPASRPWSLQCCSGAEEENILSLAELRTQSFLSDSTGQPQEQQGRTLAAAGKSCLAVSGRLLGYKPHLSATLSIQEMGFHASSLVNPSAASPLQLPEPVTEAGRQTSEYVEK